MEVVHWHQMSLKTRQGTLVEQISRDKMMKKIDLIQFKKDREQWKNEELANTLKHGYNMDDITRLLGNCITCADITYELKEALLQACYAENVNLDEWKIDSWSINLDHYTRNQVLTAVALRHIGHGETISINKRVQR